MAPTAVQSHFRYFLILYSQLNYRNSSGLEHFYFAVNIRFYAKKRHHEIEKQNARKDVRTQKLWPFWERFLQRDSSKHCSQRILAFQDQCKQTMTNKYSNKHN